jgi:hypothetical protein
MSFPYITFHSIFVKESDVESDVLHHIYTVMVQPAAVNTWDQYNSMTGDSNRAEVLRYLF